MSPALSEVLITADKAGAVPSLSWLGYLCTEGEVTSPRPQHGLSHVFSNFLFVSSVLVALILLRSLTANYHAFRGQAGARNVRRGPFMSGGLGLGGWGWGARTVFSERLFLSRKLTYTDL